MKRNCTRVACWAHCRRYFHDALQALPKSQRGPDQLAPRFNTAPMAVLVCPPELGVSSASTHAVGAMSE
ncbi:IS66 family transposase [Ideonella azotifigens]|uniref:IS66 family transposase n=1 Tax=Ideonella azotifigens TaxID=513160 RepID=UPI002175213A